MSLATREQKVVVTDFASAGRFWCFFALQKAHIERLEENTCEQLRLMTADRI